MMKYSTSKHLHSLASSSGNLAAMSWSQPL